MTDIPIIGQQLPVIGSTPSLTKLEEQIKEIVKALIIQEQRLFSLYDMIMDLKEEQIHGRDIYSNRPDVESSPDTSLHQVPNEEIK